MDGLLISVEGINGVGKTTLTELLADRLRRQGQHVLSLEGFSQRAASAGHDLGRDILRALIDAADGDPFLRGGHPAAETLLLLAIKTYDYEQHCRPALRDGYVVAEGRSLRSTAVYQSLILHPGDDRRALTEARAILELAAEWRPLPDLTLLVTDDVAAAVDRLERRDHRRCTPGERQLHQRAGWLFMQLAAEEPARVRVIDRRDTDNDMVVEQMTVAVAGARPREKRPPTARGDT
jgi:dTMP kinase